jgi:hypothetical protein
VWIRREGSVMFRVTEARYRSEGGEVGVIFGVGVWVRVDVGALERRWNVGSHREERRRGAEGGKMDFVRWA